jgi:hypothetical protein
VKQAGKNKGQEMVADPNSSGPTIDLGKYKIFLTYQMLVEEHLIFSK